jgi:dihydroorotase
VNAILRGVRVIDPLARLDTSGQDVWIDGGKILAIYHHIDADGVPVVDLTPTEGEEPCVLCPGFIDLHAHLRQPGDDEAETLETGSLAAAAGGYTHVVAMANTSPPIDTPERVAEAQLIAGNMPVSILQVAALTRGLEGVELVDIKRCIEAGAVALSDDGRNAVSPRQLAIALAEAGRLSRAVFVHPEDEEMIVRRTVRRGR